MGEVNQEVQMAKMATDIEYIKNSIGRMEKKFDGLDKKYASKLTEKIVYGMVTLIVTGVLFAVLALVINNAKV